LDVTTKEYASEGSIGSFTDKLSSGILEEFKTSVNVHKYLIIKSGRFETRN
jgi:hypothetical protein